MLKKGLRPPRLTRKLNYTGTSGIVSELRVYLRKGLILHLIFRVMVSPRPEETSGTEPLSKCGQILEVCDPQGVGAAIFPPSSSSKEPGRKAFHRSHTKVMSKHAWQLSSKFSTILQIYVIMVNF